jgi:hypothetical protein
MPSIKDYEKKKKPRRRPGREETEETMNEQTSFEEEEETPEEEVQASAETETENHSYTDSDTTEESDKKTVHIEFPYSELIRAKAPKAFEVAESVATEWVNDGNFENIPVKHPVAQMTVAAGLRKAKEVEKKLEEKGVFMMAKMGLEYAKSKLHKK